MRNIKYPKLTHKNAEEAAQVYMTMKRCNHLIWRTTDFVSNSRSKGYKETLQALWRLHDNGIVKHWTVGDAGNIWWLSEREVKFDGKE